MADDASSYVESGRRDLNATAPMRGRCFIGNYLCHLTAMAATGSYGPANITANIFDEEEAPQQHALQGLVFGSV